MTKFRLPVLEAVRLPVRFSVNRFWATWPLTLSFSILEKPTGRSFTRYAHWLRGHMCFIACRKFQPRITMIYRSNASCLRVGTENRCLRKTAELVGAVFSNTGFVQRWELVLSIRNNCGLAPTNLEISLDFFPVPSSCPYKAAVSLWLFIHDLVPSVAVGAF